MKLSEFKKLFDDKYDKMERFNDNFLLFALNKRFLYHSLGFV